ncbi:unnamed protein product [Leptosia nina]|uniref:Uncharacterized protein n=1 Tax=Leptosia nina TaxID=320188 RepID=A0AAV1K1M5_9NEOP
MSFRNYYDSSSYNRNTGRSSTNTGTERPTALTTKYTTTSALKSSSIPVPSDRTIREETPISAIANRYSSYSKSSTEKSTPSKYEKKDYSKLSVPSITSSKSREVSPVSSTSKYKITRSSRHASPERKNNKNFKEKNKDIGSTERDKDIPTKTDKSSGYSSLSNYKLYPRSVSYTRPIGRTESKPEVNYTRPSSRLDTKSDTNYTRSSTRTEKPDIGYSRSSIRTEAKPEVTVNRYAIANRLSSSSYLRSPTPIKRSLLSPNNNESTRTEPEKPIKTNDIVEENIVPHIEHSESNVQDSTKSLTDQSEDLETVTVITRHTSPTPPGSSSYVRIRRADLAKTIEKVITRKKARPPSSDKEVQSDRLDDPTRSSRFAGSSRTSVTNWTYYSPTVHNYTGYAGRYSTQYSTLRDNPNSYSDRCSRSRSKEPLVSETNIGNVLTEDTNNREYDSTSYQQLNGDVYDKSKDDDGSEIIINVNLKLKKARSPSAISMTEIVSPEITITNSQLPPQPPKSESSSKIKKIKTRKSSTDSSSDSGSTKKIAKKRTKSVSSSDSDHSNKKSQNANKLSLKKSKSNNKVQNAIKNKSQDSSNSLDSSLSLSSSMSDEENISKSKTTDVTSISTDTSTNKLSLMSNKSEHGTEEAKSFLIRALAPVTNLFKLRHQETTDTSKWLDSSDTKDISTQVSENTSSKNKCNASNVIASNEDNLVKLKAIRRIESGDRSWWLESDNVSKNDVSVEGKSEGRLPNSNDIRTVKKYADDEKPWWLDSNANIPEGIERLTPPRRSSSEDDKSEKFIYYKVRHMESGDQRDWWPSNENSSKSSRTEGQNNLSLSKSGSDQKTFPLRRIRHIESGERPWWLSSDKNIPEGIEKLPTPPPQEDSDSSESDEVEVYIPSSQVPPFPLHLPDDEPLGDRRSPEGLENPNQMEVYRNRSPYENNRRYRRTQSRPYSKTAKYISRYTDIDDILGTSSQIYSSFMDSILTKREDLYDDDDCEEIDPTQVRIHDSTAQMPVILKLHSRSDVVDYDSEDEVSTYFNFIC